MQIPTEANQVLPIICETAPQLFRALHIIHSKAWHNVLIQLPCFVYLHTHIPKPGHQHSTPIILHSYHHHFKNHRNQLPEAELGT
jgi:hypothetical protein